MQNPSIYDRASIRSCPVLWRSGHARKGANTSDRRNEKPILPKVGILGQGFAHREGIKGDDRCRGHSLRFEPSKPPVGTNQVHVQVKYSHKSKIAENRAVKPKVKKIQRKQRQKEIWLCIANDFSTNVPDGRRHHQRRNVRAKPQ